MQRPSRRISDVSLPRAAKAAAALATAVLSLAACVAVPVDPHTGLPVPWAQPPVAATPPQSAPIAPPAPAAPPAAAVYSARLYPINEIANRAGMLTAQVTDGHGGRGTFALTYLGDPMQGEASRVEANYPGFGRVLREALGANDVQLRGPRGIANATGSRGVSAQCEYVLSAPSRGTGACVFSDGARFQLHFG